MLLDGNTIGRGNVTASLADAEAYIVRTTPTFTSQLAPCTIRAMSRRGGGPAVTLAEGVYEHLITEELARYLETASGTARLIEPLDDADTQSTFARHVGNVVARAISGLPAAGADELIRKVFDHLAGLLGEDLAELVRDQRPLPPP